MRRASARLMPGTRARSGGLRKGPALSRKATMCSARTRPIPGSWSSWATVPSLSTSPGGAPGPSVFRERRRSATSGSPACIGAVATPARPAFPRDLRAVLDVSAASRDATGNQDMRQQPLQHGRPDTADTGQVGGIGKRPASFAFLHDAVCHPGPTPGSRVSSWTDARSTSTRSARPSGRARRARLSRRASTSFVLALPTRRTSPGGRDESAMVARTA